MDTDTRWDVISQSVDDRTAAERGLVAKDRIDDFRQKELVSLQLVKLGRMCDPLHLSIHFNCRTPNIDLNPKL